MLNKSDMCGWTRWLYGNTISITEMKHLQPVLSVKVHKRVLQSRNKELPLQLVSNPDSPPMVSTQMSHSQLSHELHSATTKTTTSKKNLSRATLLHLDQGRPNVQKQKHMHLGLIQEDPKCRNRSTWMLISSV
jgi:hypothetical protein